MTTNSLLILNNHAAAKFATQVRETVKYELANEPGWLNIIMLDTQDVTYAYRLSILASGASETQPMGGCITFEMRKFQNIAQF